MTPSPPPPFTTAARRFQKQQQQTKQQTKQDYSASLEQPDGEELPPRGQTWQDAIDPVLSGEVTCPFTTLLLSAQAPYVRVDNLAGLLAGLSPSRQRSCLLTLIAYIASLPEVLYLEAYSIVRTQNQVASAIAQVRSDINTVEYACRGDICTTLTPASCTSPAVRGGRQVAHDGCRPQWHGAGGVCGGHGHRPHDLLPLRCHRRGAHHQRRGGLLRPDQAEGGAVPGVCGRK
jgi:hypothetical protein